MAGLLRRILPPLALFAGLFFFGVSLLLLGTSASVDEPIELEPSLVVPANGSAVLLYHIDHFRGSDRIDVTYAFPQGPGDAYVVPCDEVSRLRAGSPPTNVLLAFIGLRNGSFAVTYQTVPEIEELQMLDQEERTCDPAIAFRWSAPDGDPGKDLPAVRAEYHVARLVGEDFAMLAVLMGGSALSALLGGLAWARARAHPPRGPVAADSTVEALRASLDRMGEQLERTRRHLLLAGVVGVFLWYPFLVPWSWQQAARATDDPTIPWAVAGLTLLFLLVLTLLWAREFVHLDRELSAWRGRMGELRERETGLLETLEREG